VTEKRYARALRQVKSPALRLARACG
jgi:hypothetical protein